MIPNTIKNSSLNGSLQKGNYIWGGAMSLAWNEVCKTLNHGPLDFVTKDELAQKLIDNFNSNQFSVEDLSPDSYYVKAGLGQ